MSEIVLVPEPLTSGAFRPYGDVIEATLDPSQRMNEARFERFDDLASIDIDANDGGHVAISIAQSRVPVAQPYTFDLMERHPLGSQAFIPLAEFSFTVVVAPAGDTIDVAGLRAFVTNGAQGINYHRGTWHMPLISAAAGQRFLIVDRAPGEHNLQLSNLSAPVTLRPGQGPG